MPNRETDAHWTAVDDYITELMAKDDAALDNALSASRTANLPAINVTAPMGKFLHLLARMIDARRILEIGTLGGYSTIWMARALRDGGCLVTIEADARHASIARRNIDRAGLAGMVDLREGKALDVLHVLEREQAGPFDLSFIDADKPNTPEYFEWALRLSRPGSVIVADNVVREGGVADASNPDPSVRGMRRLLEQMSAARRVSATVIQTVGAKGYDGFAIAVVSS
jgi:predicted O-methyltransferase YrrM